jgi:hypothetical protein
MTEVADSYEHAGLVVEFVHDEDGSYADPQQNDNAGTIYSWTRDFDGDETIGEPDLTLDCPDCEGYEDLSSCEKCGGGGYVDCDLPQYMRHGYGAVLTIGLRFEDHGSNGCRLRMNNDDPNAAICFTRKDLGTEWSGSVDDATKYAEARIGELDKWLQGDVVGIVIREPTMSDGIPGVLLDSVWGFIADPFDPKDREYLVSEGNAMAEGCAEEIAREKAEAEYWACADVITIEPTGVTP